MADRINNARDRRDLSNVRLLELAHVWAPGLVMDIGSAPETYAEKNYRDTLVVVSWNTPERWSDVLTRRELELLLLGCARWREFDLWKNRV